MLETEKRSGAKEAGPQVWFMLHAAGLPVGDAGHREGIRRSPVDQGILLESGPLSFDRIEFRGIRRHQHVRDASSRQELLLPVGQKVSEVFGPLLSLEATLSPGIRRVAPHSVPGM